jgi:hypothetical protein
MKKGSWIMILALVVLLVGCGIIYKEISDAKEFCKSVHGNASLTGKYCNGEALAKYSEGWNYEKGDISDFGNFTLNLSDLP